MAKAGICLCVFCKRIFFGISFTWKFISPVVSLLLGQIIPQTRMENKGTSSVLLSENWPHCDRFSEKVGCQIYCIYYTPLYTKYPHKMCWLLSFPPSVVLLYIGEKPSFS